MGVFFFGFALGGGNILVCVFLDLNLESLLHYGLRCRVGRSVNVIPGLPMEGAKTT